MKVQELLANIKNKDFNLERGLQVKKYLPIEAKKDIAQGIIYDSTTNEGGAIRVDSVQRYMSYVRYMITMHTNLEYTDDDYDIICSTEYGDTTLLNAIVSTFQSDANECNRILDLMMDDYMHTMSIEFTVAQLIGGLNNTLGGVIGKLGDMLGSFDAASMIPEGADFSKLNDFLSMYNKN